MFKGIFNPISFENMYIYTSNPYKEILLKLAACLCAGRTLYILSTSSSLGANVDFF